MDVQQIRRLKPRLQRFLSEFADCFQRCDTRTHLETYVTGQLSPLAAKSVEPIAPAAGVPVRTLQEFLSRHRWDEDVLRRRLQEQVARRHGGPGTIGILDETSDVKQGTKTPGVQRQWCGTTGKTDNCLVTVHLALARGDFHCLIDGELFLPESWSDDRPRCRQAGLPDEVVYRPKWQIALEQSDRAQAHGLSFDWITADEGYGGKPGFLEGLQTRGQRFVVEVPVTFAVWAERPPVTQRPYRARGRGRWRRTPRLRSDAPPATRVDHLATATTEADAPWRKYHIKDGEKGPICWEVREIACVLKGSQGLPGLSLRLLVARNLLDPDEVKYFVTNAPPKVPVTQVLPPAFSRRRVERSFLTQKQEVGLDQWEGRRWLGLKRHLILTAVSYLFLAEVRAELAGGKSGPDRRAGRRGGQPGGPQPGGRRAADPAQCGARRAHDPSPPDPQRRRPSRSP